MLNTNWTPQPNRVPRPWSDAHLVLIRKPAKTGKEEGHYRPIGLQDQLGKLTFKALVEPYQADIHSIAAQFPQYGYMPGRSHRDALRRVFDHCAHIRAKCRAHHCTLHDRFEGKAATALIGGLQVTLDLAGAFDAMPRHRLLEGMEHMNLPLSFIQIVMCWHHQAHYHINHDGTDRVVHATQGVRQGCAVAPLLWLIFSHLISAKLAAKIGYHATVNLLSIFADDYHCSGEFSSTHDLEVILSHIAVLLHTLADMGMTVSPAKSKAILKCAGPGAEQLRRRFTRKTAQGKVLRIYSAQECIDIPLVDSFTYLGAIVSYDHYEDRTLAHRLEVGSNNFGRLTRVLRGRHALTRQHKLRIWQACVYTATVYGLDACGLTPLGAKKLTAQILRQIRLIVRDPVYMTGTSHQQVLTKWNLLSPIEALRHQLHKETVDPEPQPDIFKRGPDSAAWQRVMDTLQDFSPSQLVEMHNQRTHGHPCPECGIYFATRASMLGHMTRKHKDHPARPVNQPTRTFDKHSDALGGLPQCSHCKVKLCDFSSLRKHINEQRCKVLYPTRRPPCSDTPEVTPEVIPPHTIDASAVKVIGPKLSPTPEATHVEPDPSHPASCSGAGPTDDSETQLPYFQRTSVRAMLTKYSENAAFHLQDRQWLRHYCALCSQWIVCTSKVKQHYRLSHPTDHAQYLQSASCLCSKFNTPGSPCEHCSAVTKAPRQHPAKCTVLWQICLMHLKLRNDRTGDGGASASLRPADEGPAGSHGVGTDDEEGSRTGIGPCRARQGSQDRAGQRAPASAGPSKQTTLAQRWGQGTWSRNPQPDLLDQSTGQTSTATGDGAQDPTPGLQLGALHSTGQSGAAPPPLCSGTKMEEVSGGGNNDQYTPHHSVRLSDHDAARKPERHRRSDADTLPEEGRGQQMATGRPLVLPEVVAGVGEPGGRRGEAPASTREASGSTTTPSTHHHAALHDTQIPRHTPPSRHHDRGHGFPAGHLQSHEGPPNSMGDTGGIDRPVGHAGHRPPTKEGHAQAVTGCRACPTGAGRILLIRLLNSSNTCYLNASVRAWLFAVSHLQVADILKYGAQEQAWRDVYHARRPIHVHALSSWRPLLCNWANLHQQHDACEFLEHLLGAGRPQVLQGKWESRIVSEVEGTETRGQHNTQRSITLDLADPYATTNLQALVDHWHTGGTYVQACTHPPRILLLRISRFLDTDAGETVKLHTRVTIPTAIQIPCYCDPHQGAACTYVTYLVTACVLHRGSTIHGGHYTTRFLNHLPPRVAPQAPPQWHADDSKPIEHVNIAVTHDSVLSQQCYLVLLCRTTL